VRIASWNVNSLAVRLPHVLTWLETHQPDVLCLQETKLADDKFPCIECTAAGYQALFCGQKTYNGVAILSKRPALDMVCALPAFEDPQKRLIAATVDGVRVVCVYVPNGQSVDSEKYRYKLAWLTACGAWLQAELERYPKLAVAGDYNIAPEERDVHDPKAWEGQVLFSAPERAAFQGLLALGLKDSFRLFEQPPASFTWWDYRMNAFRRKMGLRIDHILLSAPAAAACRASTIDIEPRRAERPSDHAPIYVDLEI